MDAVVNDADVMRLKTKSAPRRAAATNGSWPIHRGVRTAASFLRFRRNEPLWMLFTRFAAIFARFEARLEKHRSHRMLADLTDAQLQDIGLSRADVAVRGWQTDHIRLVPANDR
jgi:uncharacterized protein YjiS (DUF1127 family)